MLGRKVDCDGFRGISACGGSRLVYYGGGLSFRKIVDTCGECQGAKRHSTLVSIVGRITVYGREKWAFM